MSKYIVISGAPTLRELRSSNAELAPRWRVIGSHEDTDKDTEMNESISYGLLEPASYGLPPDNGPSTYTYPPSQSISQSQSQSQSFTQPEPEPKTTHNDSITSTSTASTVLDLPTHTYTRTFPTAFSQSLSQSQPTSSASSSVANFPTFHFSLRSLTPLRIALTPAGRGSVRAIILVAVLEVDGPDPITTKAGVETHLMRLVVGDDDGAVGKIIAWGETALEWGGAKRMQGLRRGDVVLLSDVLVTSTPPEPPTLSASPRYNSGIQLCYRTIIRTDQDRHLQPDLRLGSTDACVRRVAAFVEWVERMV